MLHHPLEHALCVLRVLVWGRFGVGGLGLSDPAADHDPVAAQALRVVVAAVRNEATSAELGPVPTWLRPADRSPARDPRRGVAAREAVCRLAADERPRPARALAPEAGRPTPCSSALRA